MTDLKPSSEWHSKLEVKYPGSYVMDPDGWDRKNYDYSFYEELISQEEFFIRFGKSTVAMSRKMLDEVLDGKNIQL